MAKKNKKSKKAKKSKRHSSRKSSRHSKRKSKTGRRSERQAEQLIDAYGKTRLSNDITALTATDLKTYPSVNLQGFTKTLQSIPVAPETSVLNSNTIRFQHISRPTELIRFTEAPFSLTLRFREMIEPPAAPQGNNAEGNANPAAEAPAAPAAPAVVPDRVPSGWTGKIFPYEHLLMDILFESVQVFIDGQEIFHDRLNADRIFYSQLDHLFAPDLAGSLPKIMKEHDIRGHAEKARFRNLYTNYWKTALDETRVYQLGMPGVWPFSYQSKALRTRTGLEYAPQYLHPSVSLTILLKKRPDWRYRLYMAAYDTYKARYQPNAAELVANALEHIQMDPIDLKLNIYKWEPFESNLRNHYLTSNHMDYVVDHVTMRRFVMPAASMHNNFSITIPSNARLGFIVFLLNQNMLVNSEPTNKHMCTPLFVFPRNIKRLRMLLDGREMFAKYGLENIGNPRDAYTETSNQGFVRSLYESRLWQFPQVQSIFQTLDDADCSVCQAIPLDFVGIKPKPVTGSELLVEYQMREPLINGFNMVVYLVETLLLTAKRQDSHERFNWTVKPLPAT